MGNTNLLLCSFFIGQTTVDTKTKSASFSFSGIGEYTVLSAMLPYLRCNFKVVLSAPSPFVSSGSFAAIIVEHKVATRHHYPCKGLVSIRFSLADCVTGAHSFVTGGTSLACPVIAAMVALTQEHQGSRIGFANPYLYSLNHCVYHDVRHAQQFVLLSAPDGNHLITPSDGSLIAGPGYDDITGALLTTQSVCYPRCCATLLNSRCMTC